MMKKILLDTDIGSDIDDAVCLAYLLARQDCGLCGITTVSGEATRRASMASAMCNIAARHVPIYPGIETPLIGKQRQPCAPQAEALARWQHDSDFPVAGAIAFMQKIIRDNPGEITLLAIGPLTNVAVLFAMDPEIPSLLESLVLMCGYFDGVGRKCEWNALCDAHATDMVYRSRPKTFRSVGLDVTTKVTMDAAEVRNIFTRHELLRPVLDFSEIWFKHAGRITFHDPLTAVCLFDEGVCGFERGDVTVETAEGDRCGFTNWEKDPAGPHEVALTVDPDRFFDSYFKPFAL
ncbi:MAG: nucleoside hydrolase [Victivallales bacterium]|nr:nucleoside hydrolase [Victivallales bacterium]